MSRQYITIMILISTLVIPQTVFAETFLSQDKSKKDKSVSVPVYINDEVTQRKNRIIRIESSLDALEKNIVIIETSIKQMRVRVEGIDANKENISIVVSDLEIAEAKLSEARSEIEKARKLANKIDPKQEKEVKQIKEMIVSISSLIRESIFTTRLAVKSLKPMKLVSETTGLSDQNNAKAK